MTSRKSGQRNRKRQNLLQALESRHMLAGPQLIGIQPNEGDLIVEGSIQNIAPRTLTLRFDDNQQIDPATLEGVRITRAGTDNLLGTNDDIIVNPGLVTLGEINQNEVVVRFAERLPDDKYRLELFAFDDANRGLVALRNIQGEAVQPSIGGARSEIVNFELSLGALVEAVVPQPVVRNTDGTLSQRRNEVLVYFNEDPLFIENDPATGAPTARSAENPRFYQLLLTKDTVRTTDDVLFYPQRVIYDQATHTARLVFASDINELTGVNVGTGASERVPLGGGTFRLRVGTAVDDRRELTIVPNDFGVAASVTSDLRIASDLAVTFRSRVIGESASGRTVRFINTGAAGLSVALDGNNVVFNLGGSTPTVSQLASVVAATPAVNAVLAVTFAQGGVAGQGGNLLVPTNIVSAPPLVMTAAGDTLTTSLNVGVFGLSSQPLTSITLRESIDPQPFLIDLPGGNDDPGRLVIPESAGASLLQTINQNFGPDTVSGITEIPYNFKAVFEQVGNVSQLNQITEQQKTRVREALSLWARYLGVQFRETTDSGLTFALGDTTTLLGRPGAQLTSQPTLNATLRIDPTFTNSAMVLSNQVSFSTGYGEDFFRKTMAGIGFLLGLEQTTDLTAQTLMSLNAPYLNQSPNVLNDLEPSFPGSFDILHGRYVHRPDSIDVDLYRFEVNLGAGERVGTLTAETFAERLPDSSLLDTTLTLYQDVRASVTTDFNVGTNLAVRFTSVQPGALGNSSKIEFIRTDRAAGDTAIRIRRSLDVSGNATTNGIVVDVPRRGPNIASVPVGDIVNAINNDPVASTLFRGEILVGSATMDTSGVALNYSPLSLAGGGIVQIARNDDYFSEDSFLKVALGNGVYYIGIASTGNNTYDPTITGSGFGGTTQGKYELLLKFERQVNETDTIRDLDSSRVGVPGTAIDGDGDGTPGGVHNFWFQTRPLQRQINVTGNGTSIVAGQTFTIIGANGVTRRFEFVPTVAGNPGTPQPGNIAVNYSAQSTPGLIANEMRRVIRSVSGETGVTSPSDTSNVVTLVGERSITFSDNFQGMDILGRTIFVDKTAGVNADGTGTRPFNNIANGNQPNAFGASRANDIVRIVGNGGLDNNPATVTDNFSYQIGQTETGGVTLEDGRNMLVPQGVTVMIDAGAAFKLRNSVISVGSTSLLSDRSQGALQVLGAPRLVNLTNPVINAGSVTDRGVSLISNDGDVIFTSTRDRAVDAASSGSDPQPSPGNWGGLVYRRDLDQTEGRSDLEDEGIFMQIVNHADIRYGGSSNVLIDSVQQLVNPIQVFNLRPTVTFNEISFSADAAISASPDSFEETSYQSPDFQRGGRFTADYSRVGPAINNNELINNSINGLFIRVVTTPGAAPQALTLAGRLDDTDIVHYVAENLVIAGTPGGSIQDGFRPDMASTAFAVTTGGTLAAGNYDYRLTFVDANGFESLASAPSATVTVSSGGAVNLINLPPVQSTSDYVARRLYRRTPAGEYRFVVQLDATDSTFLDRGVTTEGVLDLTRAGVRGRLDGSLVVDPGTVVKFRGARIELGQGTQLLAEGLQSNPIVFTSFADDRFGAGGTFDTNNDANSIAGVVQPQRGDWSGIYASPNAFVSFDHATVAYGGGVSLIDGGQSRGFAPLELQQADARVTNSRFEYNEDGQDGAGPVGRFGRLGVTPSTIFVRGSQPIIVGNQFVDNRGSIIDIDSDSMTADRLIDTGRHSGLIDRFAQLDDNYGPLIRLNRYENVPATVVANRQISGLEIRGGILATESVWDDTDIVHILFDSITVGNLHSVGGLRLLSRDDESLVVKLTGAGSAHSATSGTGLTATGSLTDIADRIGGSIQIIGRPGAPVVLTSFADDTVGAGVKPDGTAFTDTNGDSFGSRPDGNDWRSVLFDQFSHDRNFDYILEQTIAAENAPGLNGTIANAQLLGQLAPNVLFGDDQLRLGFEVEGFLNEAIDVDNYSFTAEAGTRVWMDIDRTSFGLDTVLEILDADGNVLARSNNSFAEVAGTPVAVFSSPLNPQVRTLQGGNRAYTEFGSGGQYKDFGSTNPRDAGLSLTLPGNPGVNSVYFARVRSASINPDDAQGGVTKGGYRFQIRLREEQEFVGNLVRFADIRYANHGVHVRGAQNKSPLLGEAQENEPFGAASTNNSIVGSLTVPGNRPQHLGNLSQSDNKVFSVGGSLSTANDIDFYQIDVSGTPGNQFANTIFDVDFAAGFNRPDTSIFVFYDEDGESGPIQPRLVLMGEDSNVLDDLAKPVSSQPVDVLTRGSVSTGDPLIGPVALSEGSYYVAVVGAGLLPNVLSSISNPITRREPIESIMRIFEDHVETIGGSTAIPPREGSMFDPATLPAGWSVTTNRSTDAGHQLTETFNGSRAASVFPDSTQFEIAAQGGSFATAQDLSLGDPFWSLAENANIGSASTNTSQFIPHTTVFGTTPNEIVDVYQFTVPVGGSQVILDIDNGFNPLTVAANLPAGVTPVVDPTSINLKMWLFDASGNQILLNSSSLASNGALGSQPNSSFNQLSEDPFIQTVLSAGVYFVAVAPEATTFDPATDTFAIAAADVPASGTYTLHVSVENHPNDGGDPNNQSLYFDRSVPTATLQSNPFDLTGYGANDLPRFYFNYYYAPGANDSVVIRARSDQNPGGVVLNDVSLVNANQSNIWRQGIASLSRLAGQTGIVVEFTYNTNLASGGEGLYLDDFIVGFAERGELITNAAPGANGISGTSTTSDGEYQLEMRPATSYGVSQPNGLQLTSTFDTNARHVEAVTIVAPFADQIADGNRFQLSDGIRTVTFEFDSNNSVVAGNIRVPFTSSSTQPQIADAIRTAINSSVVQSTIRIQASDSAGSAIGGNRDVRVALTGEVLGDFLELARPEDLPASGTPLQPVGSPFRLPVVFNRGEGDTNAERAQSQIIIDSNKISHVRAMGIWSEPGDRGVDPDDPTGTFLDRAPIGNTRPGAVRNLPTLNNSVIGGYAPGIAVRNNTIDRAGMVGVRVDGDIRPYVLDSNLFGAESLTFGDFISDGLTMTIDAGDLRVVFEFEDISGLQTTAGGSGVGGGNGFADGHVPIYYRMTTPPPGYNGGGPAHTRHEVMLAIYDAINSSILVNNGMAPLVKATLASSLQGGNQLSGIGGGLFGGLSTSNAALYIEGATNIQFSLSFRNPPPVPALNPFTAYLAPVHDSAQPVARIVNNTIYGSDGTAARFPGSANAEPSDVLSQAVDTRLGDAHGGAFIQNATLGNPNSPLTAGADVDLYRVFLGAGDRLTVDIDTLAASAGVPAGPDTVLRIFDENGIEVAVNQDAAAPDYLETSANAANRDSARPRAIDPFLDFTARRAGTYYVGVSFAGNDAYDPRSLSGRPNLTVTPGAYDISMEVFAPRSFVMSIDDQSETRFPGANTGTIGTDLVGTTFTVTQIPNLISGRNGYPVNGTNEQVFRFVAANNLVTVLNQTTGEIEIPVNANMRTPDIVEVIAFSIDVQFGALGNQPILTNHAFTNGPDGITGPSGPIAPVSAVALGGIEGGTAGLRLFPLSPPDFNTQFGHDRTFVGEGVSELYVLVERAAKITISPQAAAAGLRLDPVAGQNIDQLYPETGILLMGGTSGTVMNNVLSNLHQGVVDEITRTDRFNSTSPNVHPKPATTIVTANVFQHIANSVNVFRANMTQPFAIPGTIGITPGPSNVNGGGDDFNITLANTAPLFVFPEAGNFLPDASSRIIDSAVNSLTERDAIAALRRSVGLPVSNVLSPNRDGNGLLRADNPDVAPPGGLGGQIFKDRGSIELADFVGPVAIADFPRDNDPQGIDVDPATSFLRLSSGVYDEFRIQLRDNGDSSDPFVGSGIDDNTVVVPVIDGLRASGAAIALFEGDRLLTEGVDYTFSYDTTKNLITLKPIAGIWRTDRAYRVSLNNRDRLVAIAPSAGQLVDGDTFSVIDDRGGRVAFEYDSGFQLRVPEALSFTVPTAGTGAGGVADGDIFTITDSTGIPVAFEFNRDGTKLPGTREIRFNLTDTPAMIATAARNAIADAVTAGVLNVDVNRSATGTTVVIGSEAGTVLDTSNSGLIVTARTVALRVPTAGAGPAGVADGDVLTIHDGSSTVTFEFEIQGGLNNPANTPIPIAGLTQADAVMAAIVTAIEASPLRLAPIGSGNLLYLGLPTDGFAAVSQGQLTTVGVSRTPADGDTFTFTPLTGTPVTLELTRDATVGNGNVPVSFSRSSTGDQLASAIAIAIQGQQIGARDAQGRLLPGGLDTTAVQANPGGLVSIGGTAGLQLNLAQNSTLLVSGQPDVQGSTLLTISGPLLGQLPIVGGSGVADESQFTLSDGTNTVTFIYNLFLTGVSNLTATQIIYRTFETVDQIAASTVAAINTAFNGTIVATHLGGGLVSFGRIADNQLTFPAAPAIPAPFVVRRGVVNDGERIVIRQGTQTRIFEFEAAVGGGGVTAGAIPVVFQQSGTVNDVANILAASINNNRGPLNITASVEAGGSVRLTDTALTTTDVSNAPSITRSGQPGGAVAISFTGSFTAEDVKRSAIDAINDANAAGRTSLRAEDRGGSTFFIENGEIVEGPLQNYFLQGIKDLSGQLLKPTAGNGTRTQFTMLLPTVGLDFGDAPDPQNNVPGRYPTLLNADGPRHVLGDQVRLGRLIDVDTDGLPNVQADGDDTTIFVVGTTGGNFFSPTIGNGFIEVAFNVPSPASTADGSTVTLSTGVATATFEFDTDGIFNENNFAVSVDGTRPVNVTLVAQAFLRAMAESPLRPADTVIVGNTVRVITDDEDGVVFGKDPGGLNPAGDLNPLGIINSRMPLPITVTATGGGVLEAWIDFNFDGDFTDPGEMIINRDTPGAVFSSNATGTPIVRPFVITIPATAVIPANTTATYARFRISADGGLTPTGLALSGEVEDYRLTILPGSPPNVNDSNKTLNYTVAEDGILQARDVDGTLTPVTANDDGTLARITDPDGDAVAVFAGDVGTRALQSGTGESAGDLTLFADGTFVYQPAPDFFGNTQFTFRVTDVPAADPTRQTVSPTLMTVNLTVTPVNDRPFVTGSAPRLTRNILEDDVAVFTRQELTAFFSPGPANEATQQLVIQSAGVNGLGFQTRNGGTLTLVNGDLRYTPPANQSFSGANADVFEFIIADNPNDPNQLVQAAVTRGTITINAAPVNDPPIVGTDTYNAGEDSVLIIPINGPTGILGNDSAGPADEIDANQTISLITSDFPKATARNGRIEIVSGSLRYTPPANFTGQDQFTYRVSDSGVPSQTSTATVLINVGGDNDAPTFVGINGNPAQQSLQFNESKETEQVIDFNLSSWFSDPEGDSSTFMVTSNNTSLVTTQVLFDNSTGITTLRLRLPSFRFGQTTLEVRATNIGPNGPSTVVTIPVTVVNTPDAPEVIEPGFPSPLATQEDTAVNFDLGSVFFDPDGAQLTYSVTRFGDILNPTAAQIAASPLVQSISFSGNQMVIALDNDASGSVDIEVAASDGSFIINDSFTLTVQPVEDSPRGTADFYNVPVGARFEIIDPAQGLVGNDIDPDNDVFPGTNRKLRVDLTTITQPNRGSVTVNADGSFVYVNSGGATGETDSFTYRPIDPTGRVGAATTVTFNLGRSRYQNPDPRNLVTLQPGNRVINADVTANGIVTPLDALRIINRLSRDRTNAIPVSQLTTAPPDFLDVDGNGIVQSLDALVVINELSRRRRSSGGAEGEGVDARLATTVAFAAPTMVGLTQSNVELPRETEVAIVTPANEVASAFDLEIDLIDRRVIDSAEELIQLNQSSGSTENSSSAVDEVLSSWFDPTNL